MHFRDAFRAQYYLSFLEKEVAIALTSLNSFSFFYKDSLSILYDFCSEISRELDQILLPTIVYEIHKAKNAGYLSGDTPFAKYSSFFIRQEAYTAQARSIVEIYPYLCEMMDKTIKHSFSNLISCLRRFNSDFMEIKNYFNLPEQCFIKEIKVLSSSDKHRNQQSLILLLSNELKIIYKPVDLHLDGLFDQFIQEMNLSESFNLLGRKILAKNGYGWIEYVPIKACDSLEEIKHFYQRMGVLLAVCDTLNYSDGHCENILAYGAFPLLLDGETLFQNYTMPIAERKSIISTHLIQKFLKKQKNKIKYSALQATEKEKFESLFTYPLNDRTDDIQISYSGYTEEINHNRPSLNGEFYNSSEFIEEVVDGYCFAYDRITQQAPQFLRKTSWWDKVAVVHSRIVIRDTGSYFYLQRRIQQPEHCKSKRSAEALIRRKLGDTPYTEYEVKDTLELNIPYFYQIPKEKNLYNGNDDCYSNIFPNTALDWIKKQLLERSEDNKQHNCKIIRTYLPKKVKKLEHELI